MVYNYVSRKLLLKSKQTKRAATKTQHSQNKWLKLFFKISKSSIDNHVHQLGYVNHFDVWVPQKLSGKKHSQPYFYMQFSI